LGDKTGLFFSWSDCYYFWMGGD